MSHLYQELGPNSDYVDRQSKLTPIEWRDRLRNSSTIYVGNLSFYTTEDQIHELFGKCGHIETLVMGLNRLKKNPCGFCFVRFFHHAAANRAVELLNGVLFDDRVIRVDWDSGDGITENNRKYGRGTHGTQWRDEFRKDIDPGRGGVGGGLEFRPRMIKRERADTGRFDKYGGFSDRKKRRSAK